MLLTLQVVLVVLKLIGVLAISWWAVLIPAWLILLIPAWLILGGLLFAACLALIAVAMDRR